MKQVKSKSKTLKDLKDKHFGKIGTAERAKYEEGYKSFKIGVILQQARIKSGMTQQELADKVGTTKSYISKIENNIKEARISTIQKIVELGLGGKIEFNIKLN